MRCPFNAALFAFSALMLSVGTTAFAQHKPLERVFHAPADERFNVVIIFKAEARSVSTQTVAAQTYVTPVLHIAEARLQWTAGRSIKPGLSDGAAEIHEVLTPVGNGCARGKANIEGDSSLQASLERSCATLLSALAVNYIEDRRGLLKESGGAVLPELGENNPPLLALWLRRAIRPDAVFPDLPVQAGARNQQTLRPATLKNSEGSESTEWLEAQEDSPALSLHVVQELRWDVPAKSSFNAVQQDRRGLERETFFADSVSTISLIDGSLLRALRSATRTSSRVLGAIEGLPEPPEFSSKLSVSVAIERLP